MMPPRDPARSRTARRTIAAATLLLAALLAGGCASAEGPTRLTVAPGSYAVAFDAALAAARDEGLDAVARDRRAGIIETAPRIAGSVLEPWRGDNASVGQAIDNTLGLQRRRARFEFVPVSTDEGARPDPTPGGGPGIVLLASPPTDLTAVAEPLHMRVRVYVERAHRPGVRRHAWSRRLTSQTEIITPPHEGEPMPSMFWTPVTRDAAAERRLLARVREHLPAGAAQAE